MKLYTEEQLLEICKSVAEKACAGSLSDEWVKDQCDYYGYSKIEIDIDINAFKKDVEDDEIEVINVIKYYISKYK